jgi:gliding motility-associated-like protein
MSKKTILLFTFLILFCFKNFASHIVGGEIYYDYLGGNNYRVTLKVYRDCYTGIATLDDPAYVFIFDNAGNFIDSLEMDLPGTTILPPTINNPCFTPPTDVCVEEGVYQRIVNLPPIPGGYNLAYQRCCRNNTILNLISPGDVGSTYMAHIPDPSLALGNSSPRFTNFPPIFLCAGVPLFFDHSATDPDGDSLYYEFCDPYLGLDPCCCRLGPGSGLCSLSGSCPSSCPVIGSPPPYSFVPWQSPYSALYPMSSMPVMAVHPNTGMMTGTPNMLGQWVIGVCVSEYRNGILLDVNKRDFQFNVTNCPGLPVASVPLQSIFCFGYQCSFTQNSLNAFSFQWNFGDPTTTWDVSTAMSPTWTYPDSGTYTVTLIINAGTTCADTNTTTFNIQHLLEPEFVPPPGECLYNNSYNFAASGDFEGTGNFTWDFGIHANPSTANNQIVTNVVFDTSGTFPVTLTVTENGCTEQYTANVFVYEKPVANYGLASPVACYLQPVHFIDSSETDSPLSYQWTFGDGAVSTQANPYHTYPAIGSYLTGLIVTSAHGCIDTFNMPAAVSVLPSPEAAFTVTPTDTSIFYPDITMTDQSIDAVACSVYWGDGAMYNNCDSIHGYVKPGTYTIMQVVVNAAGCYDTAYSEVLIRPEFMFWVPNAFTPGKPDGLNDIFKPKLIGVHEYEFIIFDRWGEKIFATSNPEDGWNGYFKGKLCSNDVFVYKIVFRDDVKNDPHQYIGRVTLVR